MIWLYRLFFLPCLLLILPLYLRKMRRRGGGRRDFAHRLGFPGIVPPKTHGVTRLWIQAVSVGELLALEPLLRQLGSEPRVEICLSTTTTTGRAVAAAKYASLTTWQGHFPVDWWPCSARTWSRLQPDAVILFEGEIWPEHLHQAGRRKIPVYLLNARLSDRSFRRYRRCEQLARLLTRPLTHIAAATAPDAERFAALRLARDPVTTMGNLKFDVPLPPPLSAEEWTALRAEVGVGPGELLLVGASTWPGEEAALIAATNAARAEGLPLRALIVPRHAERRRALQEEFARLDQAVHWRTEERQAAPGTIIYLADTTGELSRLVQLADLVFVGKSLPPHTDGQTPIEAAGHGKPILFGPGMANFRAAAGALLEGGAALRVRTPEALTATVRDLARDPVRREAMGTAARTVHTANRGAVERALTALRPLWEGNDQKNPPRS